jgi:hypothetical protein
MMKYPEESWISNSNDAGKLGDLNFGGWMDGWWWRGDLMRLWDPKEVDGHQEQGSTLIRGLLWPVMLLILMAIRLNIHTYIHKYIHAEFS